jgi:hypothetical protein
MPEESSFDDGSDGSIDPHGDETENGSGSGARCPDPAIPYVHGRDLVPIRMQPRKYDNPIHRALFEQEDAVRKRIKELDEQVLALAAERRALLRRIQYIHDQLRPCWDGARGRRRRAISHEEALPPAAADATHLIGRALRAVCVALLRQASGPLTLRELHVLLHRLGYLVAHPHPAKALADALGHEADAGRVIRVERATYRAAGGVGPSDRAPSSTDHPLEPDRAEPRADMRPTLPTDVEPARRDAGEHKDPPGVDELHPVDRREESTSEPEPDATRKAGAPGERRPPTHPGGDPHDGYAGLPDW